MPDRKSAETYNTATYPQILQKLNPVIVGTPKVETYDVTATTLRAEIDPGADAPVQTRPREGPYFLRSRGRSAATQDSIIGRLNGISSVALFTEV